ncbi:hypothetical protein Ciccas_014126 [Cichlidogyrus casuarinus]|uniref:Ion transport domain-containing protein n=1 Tax=Cichlidogyrus casuarinus TaxID=1844966 RepID=A0ABD2PIY8_9PLAT
MDSDRKDLMDHSVVKAVVYHKWCTVGFPFFMLNLLIYLLFLGSLTFYMLNNIPPYMLTYNEWVMNSLSLLTAYQQMNAHGVDYKSLLDMVLYITTILLVYDFNLCNGLRRDWQWQMGSVAIFFAWINLILSTRTIPHSYATYTILSVHIWKRFVGYILLFSLFIFSFSMTFYALLRNQLAFRNLGEAIVKTSVMTIGEFDFQDVFYNRFSRNTPSSIENQVPYVELTYVYWILFLIVMCIIFINTMIATTIDDIHGMQKDLQFYHLRLQTDYCLEMEYILPQSFLRSVSRNSLTCWRSYHTPDTWLYRTLRKAMLPASPDDQLVRFHYFFISRFLAAAKLGSGGNRELRPCVDLEHN